MENKKTFNVNYIAPIILFVFVTFHYINEFFISNTALNSFIYNAFLSVICVGLGLMIGEICKILIPMDEQEADSFFVTMCTYAINILSTLILKCLFVGIFEYPDMSIKISKAICFIFIAFFLSSFLKKHILKKNKIVTYIILGLLSSFIVTLSAAASNAFWHYLSFNLMFDFIDPTPFSYFFIYDITYNIGIIGTLRYPALFLITFTFFLINTLLHKKCRIS